MSTQIEIYSDFTVSRFIQLICIRCSVCSCRRLISHAVVSYCSLLDSLPDEASLNRLGLKHQLPINRPINFDDPGLSRFPFLFSDSDITVLLCRMFQMLITLSEKK